MASNTGDEASKTAEQKVDSTLGSSSGNVKTPSARKPINQADIGRSFMRDILSESILGMESKLFGLHVACGHGAPQSQRYRNV